MGPVEIIAGLLLILSSLFIIAVVLLQESKDQGLASAIGGGANDSFFGKNESKTKEYRLRKLTRTAAIVFFVASIVVNILAIYLK